VPFAIEKGGGGREGVGEEGSGKAPGQDSLNFPMFPKISIHYLCHLTRCLSASACAWDGLILISF